MSEAKNADIKFEYKGRSDDILKTILAWGLEVEVFRQRMRDADLVLYEDSDSIILKTPMEGEP